MTNEIYLVGNLFELLAKIQYFERMLGRKVNKWIVAMVWIGVFVLDEWILRYVKSIWWLNIGLVLVFLCSLVLYGETVKKKIIAVAFVTMFQIVAEIVAYIIVTHINSDSDDKMFFMTGFFIAKITFFLLVRISMHLNRRKNIFNMENKTFISILCVPVLSIILISLFGQIMIRNGQEASQVDFMFYSIILIINYLTVIQYDDVQKMLYLNNKNRLLEEQKIYYIQQYEQTKMSWETIRSLRHNMKNEYISESILLKNGEYEKLAELYHERIGELEESRLISQSGNIYIDAIVNYKVSLIMELQANFECKILVPEQLAIEDDDIVLILGNLLDNVRDAFDNPHLKVKSGSLMMAYEKSNLYMEVKNTYEGKRKKNQQAEYVTTKKNESLHGIGMKAINSVVKKYDGYMEIKEDDKQFIVIILLHL